MNEEKIKFSIICPIYNSQAFIKDCIESVIEQKYSNWELVLINDGSTDDSGDICKTYSKKDKRIVLIDQKNTGQFIARLNAIKKISGDYVLFLDSDDSLETNALETLYSLLSKDKIDIVWFSYNYSTPQIVNQYYLAERDEIISNKPLEELFGKRIGFFLWDKCFSRELFEGLNVKVDFKFSNFAEDTFMVYLLSRNAKTIQIINKKLYHYRYNDNSKVHQISRIDQIGRDYIYSYIYSNIFQHVNVEKNIFNVYLEKYIDLVFKVIMLSRGRNYYKDIKYVYKTYNNKYQIYFGEYIKSKKKRLVFSFYKKRMFVMAKIAAILILQNDFD